MIRVCVYCNEVFGCVGYDGKKWTCRQCKYSDTCGVRFVPNLPARETTGGICDWCFEHAVNARYHEKRVAQAKIA